VTASVRHRDSGTSGGPLRSVDRRVPAAYRSAAVEQAEASERMLKAWIFLGILALAALTVGPYWLLKRAGRRLAAALRVELGARLRLVNGCGIVAPPNRVPGVLALADDRLVCRSLVRFGSGDSVIPLDDVVKVTWEEPARSRHRMARKYRRARVLGVTTKADETHVFVLAAKDAAVWENALPAQTARA